MPKKEWPNFFPNHIDVPPKEAREINRELFRFIDFDKTHKEQFLPSCLEPKQRHLRKRHRDNPAFYGTSFFDNKSSAVVKQKELPGPFEGKVLAKGNICEDHGVAKISRSKHATLWFYVNQVPMGFQPI